MALGTFRRSGWVMPKQCAMHTYATMIKAYGQSHQLNMAWKLWDDITCKKGLSPSEQLYGQMIDVLVTNDKLDDALTLFEEMKATHGDHMGSQGFAVAYAMIIKGFAQRKECARALECYEEMQVHGAKVGLVVLNSLIDACSRVGDMDSAARLFRDMVGAECVPDLITYSTLIKGYCMRGELDQATELFALMRKRGIRPDAIVFNSLLRLRQEIHACSLRAGGGRHG
jgi:pentatricopeptide repeat protein